jgi:regulatory protein
MHAMARRPRPLAELTETTLREAALAYLARYTATRTSLLRVLDRKIARWAAAAENEAHGAPDLRAAARRVVARLVESGAVSDAAFAESRGRSLQRAGKSARAIGAHLAARGVSRDLASASVPGSPEQELAAAVIHARRRRLGGFRTKPDSPDLRRREFAAMARAGFAQSVAGQALRLDREEAETLIATFRANL